MVKCACYHPSGNWLVNHGMNPGKAGCVEIGNAERFLSWTRTQPFMVLHEFAHAYHHQVLGWKNKEIKNAFKKALESKKYESVLHINGKYVKAYALKNHKEYFAELSEAFFGTNDMYPFVRAEVKRFDPLMFDLLKKVWYK